MQIIFTFYLWVHFTCKSSKGKRLSLHIFAQNCILFVDDSFYHTKNPVAKCLCKSVGEREREREVSTLFRQIKSGLKDILLDLHMNLHKESCLRQILLNHLLWKRFLNLPKIEWILRPYKLTI